MLANSFEQNCILFIYAIKQHFYQQRISQVLHASFSSIQCTITIAKNAESFLLYIAEKQIEEIGLLTNRIEENEENILTGFSSQISRNFIGQQTYLTNALPLFFYHFTVFHIQNIKTLFHTHIFYIPDWSFISNNHSKHSRHGLFNFRSREHAPIFCCSTLREQWSTSYMQ